jgi:hypothetical protein
MVGGKVIGIRNAVIAVLAAVVPKEGEIVDVLITFAPLDVVGKVPEEFGLLAECSETNVSWSQQQIDVSRGA